MENRFLVLSLVLLQIGILNTLMNTLAKNSKILNLIHLKCDVIDGSVVNGLRQPILFNFVLHWPSG